MNAPDSALLSSQSGFANWQASLTMAFAERDGLTRPTVREHIGPLRALRGFSAPQDENDLYEQIIVHPPGGIAPGDQLLIDINAGQNTNTVFTSPGAAKWYRATRDTHDALASQQVSIRIGHDAAVEWLPMESIVFNTARAALNMSVDLKANASFVGADMVCLGRPANLETFDKGVVRSSIAVSRNEQPIFNEQWTIQGGGRVLQARAGLDGASCFASLLIVPRTSSADFLESLCELIRARFTQSPDAYASVTALNQLVIVRWFGQHAEDGWHVLRSAWRACRDQVNGQTGADPRIWRC